MNPKSNIQRRIFLRSPSLGARVFLFVAFSILLMVLDTRYKQLESLRRGISTAVYPLRAVAHSPYHFYTQASDGLRTRKQLRIDNERLQKQVKDISFDLQSKHRLEIENNRLRALLESAEAQQFNLQMTEIMRVSLNPNRHHVIVNQGERSDLEKGQAVIDAQGLMGQIIRTDPMQSEIILITDTSHATPVEVNRNGLRNIAYGIGETQSLNLPYFAQNADLIEGDLLVTSGLGGRFPAGIPVAEITSIERDTTRNFLTVKATPVAAMEQSRQVAIVRESPIKQANRSRRSNNKLAQADSVSDEQDSQLDETNQSKPTPSDESPSNDSQLVPEITESN